MDPEKVSGEIGDWVAVTDEGATCKHSPSSFDAEYGSPENHSFEKNSFAFSTLWDNRD